MVKFQKFRIGDLFTAESGDTDLKKVDIENNGVPVITSGVQNYGILGLTTKKAKVIPQNTITVDMFGNVYFRDFEYKMVTHARVFSLIPKQNITRSIGLYFQTCLSKHKSKFSYDNMCVFTKLENETIELPIADAGKLDVEFIENYIRQLEADCLQQLEAYLIATGLDDYVLNDKDKKTLSLSQVDISDEVRHSKNVVEDEQLKFKEFQIDDLFVKKKLGHKRPFTKAKDTSDHKTKEFNLPLINAKMGDNGIMFYGRSQDFDHIEKSIAIIQNGAIATGKVYVQPQHTGVLWDGYLIQSNFEVDKECRRLFYIATCIEKTIRPIFNRDNKATWNRIKGYKIKLPVTDDNTLDFEYMENYIRAVEKLTIKDVVEYKDKMIALTKKNI
ncbi:restriction endonuclease subunit S [Ligilactobacillus salivarius]|uniref:restriction endonuclease subunit S n=1 Tax=Ligilactobacillus salivarius TaxID=1624 RepID=UPI001CBCE295|nr:restriction endonuclease subunit S [Ligilactobacillus salivarius]MBZ4030193.1 restriction endonuclease subunit S [Ligilactobacillus salivarius]